MALPWIRRRRVRRGDDGPPLRLAWVSDTHLWVEAYDDPTHPPLPEPPMYFYTGRAKVYDACAQIAALDDPVAAVIHTGDVVHGNRNNLGYQTWLDAVATLDPALPVHTVPGNHDATAARDLGDGVEDGLAHLLGVENRPMIAGSRFNHAFSLSQNGVDARVVMIDSNRNTLTGEHDNAGAYWPQDLCEWIAQEIEGADEDLVLLCSHFPFAHSAGSSGSIVGDEEARFISLVSPAAMSSRKRVLYLCGHTHARSFGQDRRVPGVVSHINRALIDNPIGVWAVVNITAGGFVWIERTASWPFP